MTGLTAHASPLSGITTFCHLVAYVLKVIASYISFILLLIQVGGHIRSRSFRVGDQQKSLAIHI